MISHNGFSTTVILTDLVAKLVLNTLGKMHKTEFCLNIYTDGRNTNLTERFSNKVSDCNFLTYGRSETVVIGIWDNSTLNTPYKQAVTGFGNGFMIGMSLGIEWSIQIAFAVSDTNIFVRSYTLAGIGWTGWRTI